jgi:hypothetical protein
MKLVLFLGLLAAASAYHTLQYEFGVENTVHWAPTPYHILH